MYEIKSLKDGIEKANINIQIFKDAIDKELQKITEYKQMIKFIEDKEARDGHLGRPYGKP